MIKKILLTVLISLAPVLLLHAQDFTDSNLPIVLITTDTDPSTGQPFAIVDDPRVMGNMKIIRRPDGSRNFLTDQNTAAFLNYNGRISIEIRGSSSQWLFKKGYGLTTLEADDTSNNNVPLLGMPDENDWILNGLAFDPSLIRDHISYNLAALMGNYAPRTKYCEVVINGEYVGLYLLQEKIKPDSNRVNIEKMTSSDNTLPMLSGGYITKADKLTGGDAVAFSTPSYAGITHYVHDHPKPEDITLFQHNYIRSQFVDLGTATASNHFDIATGYPAMADIPSFVDFMLINEISSNADGYQLSTYFHKDRGAKLRAGPNWDFNLTYGNDLFMWGYDRSHYDVWQFDNGDNTGSRFWKDLFLSPLFRCRLAQRWYQLTEPGQILNHGILVEMVDDVVALIAEAKARENEKWGTVSNHEQEIVNLKQFLFNRINWINENIAGPVDCPEPVLPPLVISRINFNPNSTGGFSSNNSEFIEITNNGTSTVPLAGIYLREPGVNFQFSATATAAPGQRIYIASNMSVFQNRYGFPADGQFTRNLPNSTHLIQLSDAWGNTIDQVRYDDDSPWPDADGNGMYLQLSGLELDNALAASWVASGAPLEIGSFGTAVVGVYPNPVSGWLNIVAGADDTKYILVDIRGTILQSGILVSSHKIDCSAMAAGLYFLELTDSFGARKTVKIIRE